ncbi:MULTISPECIES: hypothetical protein [Marinobacter]|uniref:TRAP-type C4-dicarboxylate transport system, small permease component n=1 Tax=Marinobacter xestospongiae TaxID=994319 RepID=A0ABU3W2L0_9GAMM|nr:MULTISPECIES: hypothetical protein [Marinobacter]MCK7565580.1 hypothetical protein [Marinobacter xestospongiae]MDV2080774.1 hypothetical protein [Marinobacter xestospongiae]UDL06275.1 hypothetical protein J2887_05815 [Marinobacter sp. CA1]
MTVMGIRLSVREVFARLFSLMFFALSAGIVISTTVTVISNLGSGQDTMPMLIQVINSSIIALAVYELAMVIRSEYSGPSGAHDVVTMLRRTLPRFIGTACVAMSLEGLIMIIKYSQMDMAGNLYYPVAIIISTAFLLAALGVFLKMTPDPEARPDGAG